MDYGTGECCEPLETTPFISSGTIVLENVLTEFENSTYHAAVELLATDQGCLMCSI